MTDNNENDGWATFASPVKLEAPAGVTVYKADYQQIGNEEIVEITSIGSVIPANQGVLLKGVKNTPYVFTTSNAADPDMSNNDLVGCVERTDISSVAANNDIFCLRYSELFSQAGFFLYSGQYIPAGKAYLPVPKAGSNASPDRRIRFVVNTATGVENTNADTIETMKFIENGQIFIRRGDAVYTIQGTRVK